MRWKCKLWLEKEKLQKHPQDRSSIRDTSLRVSPRKERGESRRLRLLDRQNWSLSALTAIATMLVQGN